MGDTSECLQCQKRGWPSWAWHLVLEPLSPTTPQYQMECISGCVCPEGLMDDGRGGCVVEEARGTGYPRPTEAPAALPYRSAWAGF